MKFSVITTCLNAEKSIKATIESVLSQKGDFDLEYIITDAGSTDKTVEIIKSYGDKIKYILAEKSNQSEGFNIGIANSTGDILSFINADDTYLENALANIAESAKSNPNSKWFIGRYRIVDESNKEVSKYISDYKASLAKLYSYSSLLIENFVPHPSTFIRKELFEKYGYYDLEQKYAMDYDLWLRIGKENKPQFVDEYIATFKREKGTKSNSNYVSQMWDDLKLGISYAIKNFYFHILIFKIFSFIRTVIIYKFTLK